MDKEAEVGWKVYWIRSIAGSEALHIEKKTKGGDYGNLEATIMHGIGIGMIMTTVTKEKILGVMKRGFGSSESPGIV